MLNANQISTMIICGSYMFGSSASKDMNKQNNNDKRRTLAYLLGCLPTLIIK